MRQVIITTDSSRKGVFYGTLDSYDPDKQYCVLTDARMIVYWSAETKGVLGLAKTGPAKGSRVTPFVKKIELNGVTSVIDCDDKAVEKFKEETIWS